VQPANQVGPVIKGTLAPITYKDQQTIMQEEQQLLLEVQTEFV
jgi:hypothetical protein